jgi:hypothetical protein
MHKLYLSVAGYIQQGLKEGVLDFARKDTVIREAIATRLEVPEHQTKQVFFKLRVMGLLVQVPNEGPHDSFRAHFISAGSSTG